jgi:hypothetical protein
VTHRYTILVGGNVIPGGGEPDVSAIAWADDTVIALGADDEVTGISRGDSHVVDLAGSCVVPLGEGNDARWPVGASLAIGGRADLAVVARDPRDGSDPRARRLEAIALIRGGRLVAGRLPGTGAHGHGHDHGPPSQVPAGRPSAATGRRAPTTGRPPAT